MKTSRSTDIEAWLDALDPAAIEWKDAANLKRIIAARASLHAAELELADAVRHANASGDSWAAIGSVLGISRQAAHRKFGRASSG